MTIKEAKEKICPFKLNVNANINMNCETRKCMAWEVLSIIDNRTGHCLLINKKIDKGEIK